MFCRRPPAPVTPEARPRRSGKSPLHARGLARTMSAPPFPGTSELAPSKSATGSSRFGTAASIRWRMRRRPMPTWRAARPPASWCLSRERQGRPQGRHCLWRVARHRRSHRLAPRQGRLRRRADLRLATRPGERSDLRDRGHRPPGHCRPGRQRGSGRDPKRRRRDGRASRNARRRCGHAGVLRLALVE